MDDENSIFLRQSQHITNLVSELSNQDFAQNFGDLKMVFQDRTVSFYKFLLASANSEWGEMLKRDDDVDVVLFDNTSTKEFFDRFQFSKNLTENGYYCSELENGPEVTHSNKYEVLDFAEHNDNIKTEIPEETVELEEDVASVIYNDMTDDIKSELCSDSKDEERLLSLVSSDFKWPGHLQAPNFHSMNWRTTSEAFEVLGNKSIFSLLEEKFVGLPSETTFSLNYMEDQSQCVTGIFRLKEFVNGGAFHDLGVFWIEGQEQVVSLRNLLFQCKYKVEKDIIPNSENINIIIGETVQNLKELTDYWKRELFANSHGKDLLRGSKFSKDVFTWLRNQAICTPEGIPICMYCGFVCYDQNPRGDFTGHMRRHLYRKRKCKACNWGYLAGDEHHCDDSQGKREKRMFPCSQDGCSKNYTTKERLVGHLKRVHRIIEKIVIMRKCAFCEKMVPDLRTHYIDAHKNETASCKFCDKTFTNPNKFKMHIKNVHERKYAGYCDICQRECSSLVRHNIQTHSSKSYPCDHCDKVFKHEKSLEDHMKSVNGTWEKKQCPECSNFYVNVSDHIRRFHRGYKNPKKCCPNCRRKISQDSFKAHKLVCIKEGTVCHICSKSVKNIDIHLAKQHKLARIQCGLCEVQVTVMGELNTHLETAHFPVILEELGFAPTGQGTEDREERELMAMKIVEIYGQESADTKCKCKFCGSETVTKTQMLTHIKYHMGYNFKRGKEASGVGMCPLCGKFIRKESMMKAHLAKGNCTEKKARKCDEDDGNPNNIIEEFEKVQAEAVKNADEPESTPLKSEPINKSPNKVIVSLPCNQCERVFQRTANLTKHIASVHEIGSKKSEEHICDICQKCFNSKSGLKKHKMSVHEKVKFPCDQCDYEASDPSNINKHRKTIHQGVR